MAEQKIFIADKPTLDSVKSDTEYIKDALGSGGSAQIPSSQIITGSMSLNASLGKKNILNVQGGGCLHGALFMAGGIGNTPYAYVYVDGEYVFRIYVPKGTDAVYGITKRSSISIKDDDTLCIATKSSNDTYKGVKKIPELQLYPSTTGIGVAVIDAPIYFSESLLIEAESSGTAYTSLFYDIHAEVL